MGENTHFASHLCWSQSFERSIWNTAPVCDMQPRGPRLHTMVRIIEGGKYCWYIQAVAINWWSQLAEYAIAHTTGLIRMQHTLFASEATDAAGSFYPNYSLTLTVSRRAFHALNHINESDVNVRYTCSVRDNFGARSLRAALWRTTICRAIWRYPDSLVVQ
jgi:hypothetical protein